MTDRETESGEETKIQRQRDRVRVKNRHRDRDRDKSSKALSSMGHSNGGRRGGGGEVVAWVGGCGNGSRGGGLFVGWLLNVPATG